MSSTLDITIILYFIAELLLSIIATIRYVVTAKASPMSAALIATLYSTVSGVATKLLTKQSFTAITITLIITNLVGVLIGRWLLDKFTKDRLWVYNVTIKASEDFIISLKHKLKQRDIQCMYDEVVYNKMYILKIFSESKEDSKLIKLVLNNLSDCKYHIIESR